MKNLFARFIFSSLLLGQVAFAQQPAHSTTVFVIRHAEKVSAAPDSGLTPAGQQRAECLAHVLEDAGIKRIYVSDTKRAQLTADPLAKALGVKPVIVPAKDVNTLVRDVFYGSGGNALVVGHSDTVPLMIERVQAGTVAPLGENEFDALFVLTVLEGSSTPAVKLRYCAASPHSAAPAGSMVPPAAAEKPAKAPAKKK